MSSRRGRGGRNPKDLPRDQQVSRKVSWLLRHGANQEGLMLGKGGYVNVRDALNTPSLSKLKITLPELRSVVAENDKQRFSLIRASSLNSYNDTESDDPADYLIRANQGHSIKVDTEGLLTPITPEAGNVPEIVVHGTDERAWGLILKSGGLRRMGRNHIHFAAGLPAGFTSISNAAAGEEQREAPPVISGMRKSSTILIFVDVGRAMEAGIRFFASENGVILTEGNEEGFLPYEFFKRVENRKKGGSVLMMDGVLPDGTEVDVEAWRKEVGGGDGKGRRIGERGGRGGRGRKRGSDGKVRVNDDSRDLFAGV
ncbi:hypothetical protein CC78DRAFT_561637 [Lojkania enalia]|uniref:2'-phosphotransferase n=1 Tax=Lojkania enalia TaxID=147567 RepID=A0A9P4K346_9PLEO|nr:hypothetical protein CC78DRAFT_561637 [Didymosphaeria enalia]